MTSTLLVGKKIGMTQVYDAQNVLVPVTVVEAGPCPVVQVKTTETDGYNAVQLGFSKLKEKNASKAEQAHAKKAGLQETPRVISELRFDGEPTLKIGDVVTVSAFTEGQLVDVIGIACDEHFDSALFCVAHPTTQIQFLGLPVDKPPKADPLHATCDEKMKDHMT